MDHIRRVVLGLGSNVGDRVANINQAVDELRRDRDMHVIKVSPLYETAAEGPPQADYLNGAVLVLTSLPAASILERSLAAEEKLGRVRGEKNAPRTIDLDILWIEGEALSEANLEVPHPRLPQRAFALRPLLDLASDAKNAAGEPFSELPAAKTELKRFG